MKKCLVVGAHLDDAILGAGSFISSRPDCDVLTVFSGIPIAEKDYLTEYDKKCGFNTSEDAMVVRRQEDTEACAILNANPIHMDRLDSQYTQGNDEAVDSFMFDINELEQLIIVGEYEMVVGPLGLLHPDHILLSDVLKRLNLNNINSLYLYEDLPHRVTHPQLVTERLKSFPTATLTFIGDGPIADKVRALWCYKSQMNTGDLDPYLLYVPERFWRVK